MDTLKPCPCGRTPDRLAVTEGDACKYAWVSGNCCQEWNVEFRTQYHQPGTPECYALAVEAWNDAPRGEK